MYKITDEKFDQAVNELRLTDEVFYQYNKDMSVEYNKILAYLQEQWNLSTEDELLNYMKRRRIEFWSLLPGEREDYYQYFLYYLQLPIEFRSKTIMGRIVSSVRNDTTFSDAPDLKLQSPYMLFWEIRAHLYEQSVSTAVAEALHNKESDLIAAAQRRSLVKAHITDDIATELLTGLLSSIRSIDYSTLSPTQIAKLLDTAVRIVEQSDKQAERALALTDLVSALNQLNSLENETLRFVNAEVVDGET